MVRIIMVGIDSCFTLCSDDIPKKPPEFFLNEGKIESNRERVGMQLLFFHFQRGRKGEFLWKWGEKNHFFLSFSLAHSYSVFSHSYSLSLSYSPSLSKPHRIFCISDTISNPLLLFLLSLLLPFSHSLSLYTSLYFLYKWYYFSILPSGVFVWFFFS